MRLALTDSTTIEIYDCADNECSSIFVIYTVCAPKCSSCVRVYNKVWEYLFSLEPPFKSAFPVATVANKETGRIEWKDNDDWEY